MSFCSWLISLSILCARFIHVVACIRISFLIKAEYYSIVSIKHILLIHSSVTQLVLFPAFGHAVNVGVHVSVSVSAFTFLK